MDTQERILSFIKGSWVCFYVGGKEYSGTIVRVLQDSLDLESFLCLDPAVVDSRISIGGDDDDYHIRIPREIIDFGNVSIFDQKSSLWLNLIWDDQVSAWKYSCKRIYPSTVNLLEKCTTDTLRLRAVGYWASKDEPFYPHPAALVRAEWRREDRKRDSSLLTKRERSKYLGR